MLDKTGIIKQLLLLYFILHHLSAFGLTSDTLILNKYSKITHVFSENNLDPDSFRVSNPSLFKEEDVIVIHQAKGMGWDPISNKFNGESGFAGCFEFHLIYRIVGDTIILPSAFNRESEYVKFAPDQLMQVVKVPSYDKYVVDSTLTASPWDGEKGGIFAIVTDTLEFNANIDVTAKGFLGGNPGSDDYTGACSLTDSANYSKDDYTFTAKDSSGLKGESVVMFDNFYRRGAMCLGNGGGGGNGYHAGGGGGSNFGIGGKGGVEASLCGTNTKVQGIGGMDFQGTKFSFDTRASFGGGGGSSTQKSPFKASKGGNGGGIVFIIANVIIGNNYKIIANGQTVTDTCDAGAGGGGGGGSILFDVNRINGLLTLQAKGGRGGITKGTTNAGSGGGGGGGLIFHNEASVSATLDCSRGLNGTSYKTTATPGVWGVTRTNLLMPVKDFLFNVMPANQEICAGEIPKLFEASKPKGGNGNYYYKWLRSTDMVTWDSVAGTRNFQESSLFDTTFYKRIVKSYDNNGDTIIDESTILTIKVLPAILNNVISSDTFARCEGLPLPIIHGTSPAGGNGVYTYQWQDSINTWINAAGNSTAIEYVPPQKDTVNLRRVIKSGVCTSYSNKIIVNLLAKISNNIVSDTQWVSQGVIPKPFTGLMPNGGNTGNYIYKWQQSADKNNWTDATGVNVNSGYIVPLPLDTIYYKRIVFSGQFNTCKDTSNILTVYVLDSLQNNTIFGSDTICSLTAPSNFTGTQPTGGDKDYYYQWEKSSDLANWDSVTTSKTVTYNPGTLMETTYFRRIVLSGNYFCCKDTSNTIRINVRPYIKNNIIATPDTDTVICYNQKPDAILAKTPYDGDGPYKFTWQSSANKTLWIDAPGQNMNKDYQSGSLTSTVYLRRKIESGVCVSYSDTLEIKVLPLITSNSIISATSVCKYSAPDLLSGSQPENGDGKYKFKWLKSTDNLSWVVAPGNDSSISYQPDTTSIKLYFKRFVASGMRDCCKDTSAVFTISINELPTANITSFDDSICQGSTHNLNFILTGKNAYKLTYTDGKIETDLSGVQSDNYTISVKPESAGIYNYTVTALTDGNNCKARELKGLGKLTVFTIPKAVAGIDESVCGLNVNLKAVPSIGKGIWSSNIATTFVSGESVANQIASVADYGKYTFIWKENNGGCIDSDSVDVTFYFQPSTVAAGEDKKGSFLFHTTLNAEPAAEGTGIGRWSSPDSTIVFSNDTLYNTYVENLKFGENILVWTRSNGVCNSISDTLVIATGDIRVPNGFSPNNDFVNDVFEIIGLEQLNSDQKADLLIVNKWGVKVYESKDYKNNWNGTFKGNDLPEDTYFYILNVIGKTYKGFVTIRR